MYRSYAGRRARKSHRPCYMGAKMRQLLIAGVLAYLMWTTDLLALRFVWGFAFVLLTNDLARKWG